MIEKMIMGGSRPQAVIIRLAKVRSVGKYFLITRSEPAEPSNAKMMFVINGVALKFIFIVVVIFSQSSKVAYKYVKTVQVEKGANKHVQPEQFRFV